MIMKSSAPVICVTGDENSIDYKNIVLPLDLTKSVRLQVFNAISFGLHFKSKIHLVSAINAGVPFRKSRIFRKMRKVQKTIVENGVECTMELFKRSHELPYKVVQKYAHEIGGDLIMIMTHSENITSDNYIGAFAHHIVNESRIPVISFSHKAAEEDEGDFFTTLLDPLRIFKK
jgi:nucleotide-binding universal stress UspA family protein